MASNTPARGSSASPVCAPKYEPGTLAARIERELQHQIACCKLRLTDESLDSLDRLGWRSRVNAYNTALQILEWEASITEGGHAHG